MFRIINRNIGIRRFLSTDVLSKPAIPVIPTIPVQEFDKRLHELETNMELYQTEINSAHNSIAGLGIITVVCYVLLEEKIKENAKFTRIEYTSKLHSRVQYAEFKKLKESHDELAKLVRG